MGVGARSDAFLRAAAIVHTPPAMSVLSHGASWTSPDPAAGSTRSSIVSMTAGAADADADAGARAVLTAAAPSVCGAAPAGCCRQPTRMSTVTAVRGSRGYPPGRSPRSSCESCGRRSRWERPRTLSVIRSIRRNAHCERLLGAKDFPSARFASRGAPARRMPGVPRRSAQAVPPRTSAGRRPRYRTGSSAECDCLPPRSRGR